MQWISIDDGDVEAYELANILSALRKVGAQCSDGDVGPIDRRRLKMDYFI